MYLTCHPGFRTLASSSNTLLNCPWFKGNVCPQMETAATASVGRWTSRRAVAQRTVKCATLALLFLLLTALQVSAVEHPGIIPKGANCVSCHTDKTHGKSVHSAMALPCSVCHLATTQEDLTIVNLAASKQQICFGCHLQSTELQKHSPRVDGACVDCHDPHASQRRELLRASVQVQKRR